MNADLSKPDIETLWRDLSDQLRSYIRRRVADNDTAEDILQDVFMLMHASLCCLRRIESVRSWAFRIARNRIVDSYRAGRRTSSLLEDLTFEEDGFEAGDDLRAVLASSLRSTAESLAEPYREALILVDFEGWDQAALAKKQCISLSGAKSRVQRARRMLRDALLACCHFEFDARGGILDYYERCCCCQPRFTSRRPVG